MIGGDKMDFNEFKEKVRNASDIADVIGRYVSLKRSGNSYKGLCPFHNEKTPSFHVMPDDQYFYCFGCHKGGDVFSFMTDYNNLEFMEALEELARSAGMDMPEKFEGGSERTFSSKGMKTRLFEMYKEAAEFYYKGLHSSGGDKAKEYLNKRGISNNMITAFGLGFAAGGEESLYAKLKEDGFTEEELKESGLFSYKTGKPRDNFFNRVMFPIMNKASKVIAFGGRVMGEGVPKYINSPETIIFSKKDNLYGIHRAVRAKSDRIILVEGYMDVIAAQQAGFTETIASLGTALTEEQAHIISGLAGKVYLIYDSDNAGTAAKLRAIPILRRNGLYVYVADLSPYKDPDELIKAEGAEGFEKRLENAQNAFFFEISELSKEYDLDDPAERAGFEAKTAGLIAAFDNSFERGQYIETISDKYNIDKALMQAEVSRIGNLRSEGVGIRYKVSGRSKDQKIKKNTDLNADEKNVLCALIKSPDIYPFVAKYISPADFSSDIMKELADDTFTGIQHGGITVAGIMDRHPEEEKAVISRVFSDEKYDGLDEDEKKCFASQSVLSILKRSIGHKMALCTTDNADEYRELCIKKKEADSVKDIFS